MRLFPRRTIERIAWTIPRDELVRRSRILVVDDEAVELLKDLRDAHFAVDHFTDLKADDISRIEKPLYDLVLLDFGNVGSSVGPDQGLSILRLVRRVNPAIVVLAFTSKALRSQHADFYRDADGVLQKDAGIAESMERIEEGLRLAQSPDRLWTSILSLMGIERGSERELDLQDLAARAVSSPKRKDKLLDSAHKLLKSRAGEVVAIELFKKFVEHAITHAGF